MFAPRVATAQAKAPSSSSEAGLRPKSAALRERRRPREETRPRVDAVAAKTRLLNQGPVPATSWDFCRIPVSVPDRAALSPITPRQAHARWPDLSIGPSGDRLEREADHLAEQMARTPKEPHKGDPLAGDGFQYRKPQEYARRLAANPVARFSGEIVGIAPAIDGVANSAGRPLDAATRARMEARFGADFGNVRVHTDEPAAAAARDLGAAAYTLGLDLVFAAGRYQPGTAAGDRLLAHELTHVLQQSAGAPALQRSPDEAKTPDDTPLPFEDHGVSFFEDTISGVHFMVGVETKKAGHIRATMSAIAKQVAADNARISYADDRVMTVFIVPTSTRFAYWQHKPVLMLDPKNADTETAAHEMGHAIFVALQKRAQSEAKDARHPAAVLAVERVRRAMFGEFLASLFSTDAAEAGYFGLMVADIFAQLSATKRVTIGKGKDAAEEPAGLWIADPSQWGSGGAASEHPWDNAEEFFASAKAAAQIDRKGFERAIAHFTEIDPSVGPAAKKLLTLLDGFLGKGQLPSTGLPKQQAEAAQKELSGIPDPSAVENAVPSFEMNLLLNPGNRPRRSKARH